ncbi:MAG: NAD-binding protein [Phycisphaerales bacterium]|nr:NAD-binding protein [Phycisphaerales bacterium]
MPSLRIDKLKIGVPRRPENSRWWREWCFLGVCWRHFRVRLAILFSVLIVGGLAFRVFEPDKNGDLFKSVYCAWSLIFGEPPEEFPKHPALRAMFFLLPIVGLTVIVEAIIDFSLVLRDRRRFERSWCLAMASAMTDHVVLIGMGKLGLRTFQMLRRLGMPVVVIERDPQAQFLEEVRREGSPVLVGDGRRDELMIEANVAKARSVVLCTNDDLANLEMALDARRLSPKIRVVLRMFDQNMADKIRDGFNIHIAMSQSAISAPLFAITALGHDILHPVILNDQLVIMQRWLVRESGPLHGRTVGAILADLGFSVVEFQRSDSDLKLFPAPDVELRAGDRLLVQGAYEAMMALQASASLLPEGRERFSVSGLPAR